MKSFLAKNPKQLDICLKLLYSEHVPFVVNITETTKKKVVYEITADAEEPIINKLMEKYRILIS